MNNEVAINIENLVKKYKIYSKPSERLKETLHPFGKRYSKDFYALNGVDIKINKGEVVGIIGRNGAGKSTLLKIITGVLSPSSGQVQVNGRIASLLELGAGFNPEMTGIENVYMNGTIMGCSKEEIDSRLQDIINFADIGDFINQPVKMYSSGMFARLAFSVNVNVKPEILIVDEALSVGDSFFQQKCIQRMKDMQADGVTVLFVSHSIGMVKSLCTRCIYLKNGQKIADGLSDEVCDVYQNETTSTGGEIVVDSNVEVVKGEQDGLAYFRIDSDFGRRMTQRSGNMNIEFTAFDCYNNGEIVSSQLMLEPLHFVISGIAHANIPKGTSIGILCRDHIGNDIFVGNLNYYDVLLPELSRAQKFVIELVYNAPLAPGEYFFGVGAKPHPDGDVFYDRGFNVAKIDILQGKAHKYNIGGVFYAALENFHLYI